MKPWYPLLFLVMSLLLGLPNAHSKTLGAIATQHPLATEAGANLLKQGGNAMDAAVAAALTLAVVEPYNSGLGGGGMALVFSAKDQKVYAIDFRERAPLLAEADMFQKAGLPEKATQIGPLAIATPGEIQGLEFIHRRWGARTWSELFTAPLRLAKQGFKPDPELLRRVEEKRDCLSRDYDTFKVYAGLLQKNTQRSFTQADLAQSLKNFQNEGAAALTKGTVAQTLVQNLTAKGSLLRDADLQSYQVVERLPLHADFPWGQVWGMPPPSSGGVSVLHGLRLLEALGQGNPEALQKNWANWFVASLGVIFEQRNRSLGDPDFASPMPLEDWISKQTAQREASDILQEIRTPQKLPPAAASSNSKDGHTTHLSVIDAEGNAVSMTLTLNLSFGSCVTAGQTGILMNNEMDDFSTRPGDANAFGLVQGSANSIAPGKRPLSSMSPTLVTQGKQVILALGSPGGPKIISSVLGVLARRFLLNEKLEAAIAFPRLHYQVSPPEAAVETQTPPHTLQALKNRGIQVDPIKPWGNIQAVSSLHGAFTAQSDTRASGQARVVTGE